MQNGEEKKKITRKTEKLENVGALERERERERERESHNLKKGSGKAKIALKQKLSILIFALIVVVTLTVALLGSKFNKITSEPMDEIARSMEYRQVRDGDENVAGTNDCVKFDAFFLRDLNDDGITEGIRGMCRTIGEHDTLYMELKVQAGGHLENGIITINGENFYFNTAIPKDNVIKENAIGKNIKEIKLNTITSGAQRLLTGMLTSGDYSYGDRKLDAIGNNIDNYSKKGKVTLTGTYVSDDGNINTEIKKEIEFDVDWHGTLKAEIYNNTQNQDIETAIDDKNEQIKLNFTVYAVESNKELILKDLVLQGEIPLLNNYPPVRVECTTIGTNFNYDYETRKFTIEEQSTLDEETKVVTKTLSRNSSYKICAIYPIEAYRSLGTDAVELNVPVSLYYTAYNNPNNEFSSIVTSDKAETNILITYKKVPKPETEGGTRWCCHKRICITI